MMQTQIDQHFQQDYLGRLSYIKLCIFGFHFRLMNYVEIEVCHFEISNVYNNFENFVTFLNI